MNPVSTGETPNFAILVVDDDPDLLRFIAATLRRSGYTVFAAADSREAVKALTQHGPLIQVLLIDVVMPELSGPHLAQQLMELRPELVVVYMSGYRRDHLERFGPLLDPARLLSKPFTPKELMSAIEEASYRAGRTHRQGSGSV